MAFSLMSPAFAANSAIPRQYTCDGDNRSPPFAWSGAPDAVRSFFLACTDPDAPGGVFHHWVVYNLPAETSSLASGYKAPPAAGGAKEAINDFRKPGYGGPCPPHSHGVHHYHFRLLALATPELSLPAQARCRDAIEAARPYTIAFAELVGLYER